MAQCAKTDNITCTSDPASCTFVLNKDCVQVMLETTCTVDMLTKLSSITEDGGIRASSIDPKLSVNEQDCIYEGSKVGSFKEIIEKSDKKIDVFNLKMSIEECNILKIDSDAEEAIEEQNAIENSTQNDQNVIEENKSGESEEMDTNLAGLVDNLSNELNLVVSEVLKEKIEQVSQHIIALRDQSGLNESGGNESGGNDDLNTTEDGE